MICKEREEEKEAREQHGNGPQVQGYYNLMDVFHNNNCERGKHIYIESHRGA